MSFFTNPTGSQFPASAWPKANLAAIPPGSSSQNFWQDSDAAAVVGALNDTWGFVNANSGTITSLSSAFWPLSSSFVQVSGGLVTLRTDFVGLSSSYLLTSASLSGFLNTSYPAFQSQMYALSGAYTAMTATYWPLSAAFYALSQSSTSAIVTQLSQSVYDWAAGISASMWGFTGSAGYTRGFYDPVSKSGTFSGINLLGSRARNAADPADPQDLVTLAYLNNVGTSVAFTATVVFGHVTASAGPDVPAVKIGNQFALTTGDTIATFYSDDFNTPQLHIHADGRIMDVLHAIHLAGNSSDGPNAVGGIIDNEQLLVNGSAVLLSIRNSGSQVSHVSPTGKAFFSGSDMRSQKITNIATATTTGDAVEYDQFSTMSSSFIYDRLLVTAPWTATNYVPTYNSNLLTKEEWTRAGGNLLKSIDYTYTGSNVTTEVTKVFDTNGTSILRQSTTTYTYTNGIVTAAATVRNV